MIVITINNIIINVTSFTALYRAKSGVKTPMSSPPFDTVIAVTERNDKYPFLLDCFSVSDLSRNSKSLFIPMIIGIVPMKPMTTGGTANARKAAEEEITTSKIIPRNCSMITLHAKIRFIMDI